MNKAEIVKTLSATEQEIQKYFSELPQKIFFAGTDNAWSPAHHLMHLAQSVGPVAMALGLPKLLVRLVAGKPHQHRNYAELKNIYLMALKNGAQATGRFVPKEIGTTTQQETIAKFLKANHGLLNALTQWQENQLDEYALPHPVLGQLSVREMLFFTDFHNRHHLDGVRKKLA